MLGAFGIGLAIGFGLGLGLHHTLPQCSRPLGQKGGTISTGRSGLSCSCSSGWSETRQGKGAEHTLSLRVPVRVPRQTGLFTAMLDDETKKGLLYGVTLAASIWLLAYLLSVI